MSGMRLPLIAHRRPDCVLAWRDGRALSAADFLRDVTALATELPRSAHVLNLCTDRYRFAVAFAASLLREQCSLLPSTHTAEVLRQLLQFAPDAYCLSDDPRNDPMAIAGAAPSPPLLRYPPLPSERPASAAAPNDATAAWSVPQLPVTQLAAYVFTSGSTGAPVPHAKSVGALAQSVRAEAERLPPVGAGGCAMLATVPPQHMYGFESTVLLPLHSAGILCAERPFYPADIVAALQALPQPRVLFSTPVHLRALLSAGLPLPAVELVVSATALLPVNLAREVEHAFGAPLLEIYGSTETGQVASRRTIEQDLWQLWPGVRLRIDGERCIFEGGHVTQPIAMPDILEPVGTDTFRLHGRSADLINIAGKRSSLAYLNHQLNAIAGIIDGAFFLSATPHGALGDVARLGAAVVAPGLTDADILRALRTRIDPVFLPRPLIRVTQLPRNATGKLTQAALQALTARDAPAVR